MAQFDSAGLDGLMMSLGELAALPDEVARDMLIAEGEILKDAHVRKLRELGLVESGQLAESVAVSKRLHKGKDGPYILVAPQGTRKPRGKQKTGVRNAEVGFIQEFGAPKRRIKPKQWMRVANEGAVSAAVDAAAQVYDKWLKRKGL